MQKQPRDLDHKVAHFNRFIIGMRKRNEYTLHCIRNMDEIPINFNIMADRTADIKGAKTVQFRGTDHEDQVHGSDVVYGWWNEADTNSDFLKKN